MIDNLGGFLHGLALAATAKNLLFALVGSMVGTLIGVLPGIGPLATISMLMSFTITTDPLASLIMLAAMMLNLLLASLAGVFIPLGLRAAGRDPALGSSVILTAITDAMGFLIFLGLAALFLG